MPNFYADLHLHSPHSIAVSQSLNLDTMVKTCKEKKLDIIGTGDILQPEWMKYMEKNLEKDQEGAYTYKNIKFILQTEIEDEETVHQVVFFPNFDTVRETQSKLKPYSKNILDEWGGRPRVNLPPPELVEMITELGGIIGPAHAFTPYRAIFRQGRFESLQDCYQDAVDKIFFLELGLSADTYLADRLESLKDITFLSNSDAHSQNPYSLGREFNRFLIEAPTFEEILLALRQKDGRKVALNVGLHPKLGKYYNMFCGKCRRRVIFKKSDKKTFINFSRYSKTEDFLIYHVPETQSARNSYIKSVAKQKIVCPVCKEETGNNYKIKLGVSERIEVISSYDKPHHPSHRPPYIHAVPLVDIIRSIEGIKSRNSKTVTKAYDKILKELGAEYTILLDLPISKIKNYNENIGMVIEACRNDEIEYTPGGGGTYGKIDLDIDA